MPVRLTLSSGEQSVSVDLKDGVYRLGREKPADVVIPDSTVSSNHAELQVRGEEWTIRDLGSTNGTFLNDDPVRAAKRVRPSDRLRLGSMNLRLSSPVQEAAATRKMEAADKPRGEKIQAARAAAGKIPWTFRYWIAGAEAILFLLVLFFFVQLYTSSAASKRWLVNRYRLFAAQYMHVLSTPMPAIPAPLIDDSLTDPMVMDREGKLLYPVSEGTPPPSPIIDPTTKAIYSTSRVGLYPLPGSANEEGVQLRSYPIRSGGEIVGYIAARPSKMNEQGVGFALLLLLLSAAIALILLYFALRPVHDLVRRGLEGLRIKISPLANGFVDELPRSDTVPEANLIADEVEAAVGQLKGQAVAGGGAVRGGGEGEFTAATAELFSAIHVPHCFVDQDFSIIHASSDLRDLGEFARASKGQSLFDAGMTSVQSKQLVQAIGDARRDGSAEATLQLTRRGVGADYTVTVTQMKQTAGRSQLFGIAFNPRE
jgi:hypothetical protein